MRPGPDAADIDELLAFLPAFSRPGRMFAVWQGGQTDADGVMTMPYPVYPPEVGAFFRLAAQACWSDPDYTEHPVSDWIADDDFVARATLAQIRTMLTHCVRGERFCDGHWDEVLTSGRIVAILRRLEALTAER